ncbi:hypothetical protein EDB84DRAFT_1446866 [Lactarius hengduanensis]|nr:hypothetical protein EDB84DRAFT_1446866 [Lactarius hengduanensis]
MNVTWLFFLFHCAFVQLLPCRYCNKPHNPYSTGVFQRTRPPRRGEADELRQAPSLVPSCLPSSLLWRPQTVWLPTSAARDPDHDNVDVAAYDPNPNLAYYHAATSSGLQDAGRPAMSGQQKQPPRRLGGDDVDDRDRDHFKGEATMAAAITTTTQRLLQGGKNDDDRDHVNGEATTTTTIAQ